MGRGLPQVRWVQTLGKTREAKTASSESAGTKGLPSCLLLAAARRQRLRVAAPSKGVASWPDQQK